MTLGKGNVDANMASASAENNDKKPKEGSAAEGKTGGLAKLKDPFKAHEILEVAKQVPQARFGHTITMVHKYKVVLFGGATGDTGKYSMTGETFIFNILLKTWTELNVKGVPPSPRAAHASTNVE